jgi:hypothetical protein
MHANSGLPKRIVQLVLRNSGYALWLRSLLLEDGVHRILLVDRPDMRLGGIVVVDEDDFDCLLPILDPERFVVIVHKGTNNIALIWNTGIRHVVFEEDALQTAQLAVIATEMKLGARLGSEGHDESSIKRGPVR